MRATVGEAVHLPSVVFLYRSARKEAAAAVDRLIIVFDFQIVVFDWTIIGFWIAGCFKSSQVVSSQVGFPSKSWNDWNDGTIFPYIETNPRKRRLYQKSVPSFQSFHISGPCFCLESNSQIPARSAVTIRETAFVEP